MVSMTTQKAIIGINHLIRNNTIIAEKMDEFILE